MLGLGMARNGCEGGAQGERCLARSQGGRGDSRFEQLVLGWLGSAHGTAGKIPQYFDKTTQDCIWSSQVNAGARHGKKWL